MGDIFFWKKSMGSIYLDAFITTFSYFIGTATWRRLGKTPSATSKVAPDAQKDLKKREDFLPVQKHCSGGDGQQDKKGIDVLRTGSAGGGRGKNGHSKVVVSALEGAIGEQPVHSGGLANGSGASGADPKMKKPAAPPSWYGHKFGSCKENGEMASGEERSWSVKLLAVLLFLFGKMPVLASADFTLVYQNDCPIPIFPSLIPTGGSPKLFDRTSLSAIGPNIVQSYTLPDGWEGIGLFGTGCISDGSGSRNCATGNCEGRDCTAEDSPVATTFIIFSDGSIAMSADRGYNVGLEIEGMHVGCGPSASCKAQLGSCPNNLRVLNSSRAVVGCNPGTGLHFSENQCTIPGDYSASTVKFTCPMKNPIIKIKASCQ
ncbi:uncharacterized protein LOC115663793 [Syzygium oleosum]|uniref:uncharacterized protein LOC115663793 n=1 Tax=Syzygium oleosum TaxID=219896 RepID=UPI0011D1A731|nr:uncharacterized protein LOC115663793 [Syzygium oleosum]